MGRGEGDENSACGPYLKGENWFIRQSLNWVQEQLNTNTFPRDDYRELCELVNFVLGGNVSHFLYFPYSLLISSRGLIKLKGENTQSILCNTCSFYWYF